MRTLKGIASGLVALCALASPHRAGALPIELKDGNGTRYFINTDVDPLLNDSDASGAVTNATYLKPVTITSYYVGLTTFGWFLTTYTVQRQVDIPLKPAFAGFNGLLITGIDGAALPSPLVYNPGQDAAESCESNGKSQALTFQPQTFPSLDLQVSRQVFVSSNSDFVRWLNIVTNTGPTARQVGISLVGMLGSGSQTKIGTTSDGDTTITAGDLWFTSGQLVPSGVQSTEPTVGFILQGSGAVSPPIAANVNSLGQAIATYNPTIPAGGSAIILSLATVQGNFKNAKKQAENLVSLPSPTLKCMSEQQLAQVVNFAPITPPRTKNATITLKFNKTGQDTIQWNGKITIAAGINLQGLPVTVDVGGVLQSFVLNKQGQANDGGGNKFALNAKIKNGLTKQGDVKFSFNLKGSFQEQLAAYGLTDASASKVPVTVPVVFTAGPGVYSTDQAFTYKATQGKKGTASSS